MSETTQVKATPEESLARVYTDMFKTMLFFAIGWVILMYFVFFTGDIGVMAGLFIGGGIAAGPVGWAALTGAGIASMFKADYEVVTKDSNGNVVSRDGGAQSQANNLVGALFIIGLVIAFGVFIQVIRFIIQTIKYIYYYAKCSMKPTFMKSGYAIIVAGFIILIGVPSVFAIPGAIADSAYNSAVAKSEAARDKLITAGTTIWAINDLSGNTINLYEQADDESNVLVDIPKGRDVKLTATGSPVRIKGEYSDKVFVPVEYQGTRGFVNLYRVFVELGTGVAVRRTSSYISNRIDVPIGDTVRIGGYRPPNNHPSSQYKNPANFEIEYEGRVGYIRAEYIEISDELKKALKM